MKTMRMIFVWFLAVALLIASGCTGQNNETAPELLEPVGMEPDNAVVTRGEISNITTCEGLVLPVIHKLSFNASGIIDEVLVCVGSEVHTGDVLAKLDSELYENALAAARDELDYNLRIWELSEKIVQAEIDIAKLELEEMRSTGESGIEAELKEIGIAELENKLSADKAMWQLSLAEYETNIAQLEEQVAGAFLVANCDGTVVSCTAEEGMYALPGTDLIHLAEDDNIYISADYISADQVNNALDIYGTVAGHRVEVAYEAMDRVEFISRNDSGKEMTSTFNITDSCGADVASGMSAVIFLQMQHDEDALIIPACAVRQDNGGYFVYIVNDSGTQEKRSITRGIFNDAYVQVLEGLEEGDVIYAGN